MNCQRCVYWDSREGARGFCRARSPSPINGWPATAKTDWCGECVSRDAPTGRILGAHAADGWTVRVYENAACVGVPITEVPVISIAAVRSFDELGMPQDDVDVHVPWHGEIWSLTELRQLEWSAYGCEVWHPSRGQLHHAERAVAIHDAS